MVSGFIIERTAKCIPSQDHCISNIRTLELIKTEDPSGFGDIRRNHGQGIEVISILHLYDVHALVHVLHEVVEVNAGLIFDIRRKRIKEQIHQHSLSAPNIAIHIHAFRQVLRNSRLRLLLCASEEGPKESGFCLRIQSLGVWVNNFRRVIAFQGFEEVL